MNRGVVAVERRATCSECVTGGLAVAVLAACLSVTGCASDPPQPSPNKKEIRGDSDRLFEKMKQEEQGRSKDADAPAR